MLVIACPPLLLYSVNDGDDLNAVSEQSLAENVTRVLYPNDNVIPFPLSDQRA